MQPCGWISHLLENCIKEKYVETSTVMKTLRQKKKKKKKMVVGGCKCTINTCCFCCKCENDLIFGAGNW